MNTPIESLKDRLRKALRIHNITQQELSDLTGIPKASISQYISGYAKPKQDRIYQIANALNINEAWLLGYDVEMTKKETINKESKNQVPETIAAHFEGKEFSDDDIKAINDFIEFVKSKK